MSATSSAARCFSSSVMEPLGLWKELLFLSVLYSCTKIPSLVNAFTPCLCPAMRHPEGLTQKREASGFFSSLYKAPYNSCLDAASSQITIIDLPLSIDWELGNGKDGSNWVSEEGITVEHPKPAERQGRCPHLEILADRRGERG